MNRRMFAVALGPALMMAQLKGPDDIVQAEKAWVAGITKNDQAALAKLLADGLVYTHSSGVVDTKKSYMNSLKGPQKYTAVDYSDVKVNRYGDTAILTGKVRMQGTSKGVPFNNVLLLTHVWVKNAGQWQLAAHQTTLIPPASKP